ncbi:putative carboxypeptidase S1 [Xylariales sp. AK1849]|nr:putative carboxypeptidase S1 [Xylariales sp. AK1849]
MRFHGTSAALALSALIPIPSSATSLPYQVEKLLKKQVPAEPTGVKTITSPNNVTIRYKEPGKEGVCETTPGVNSYSGYVDLDENTHMFFWFFEARSNPNEAPITLWLNGGPGSDSLIGLFEELGPCNVTSNYTTAVNPFSWNEASNLLFLSQPLGVGLSYADEVVGVVNQTTGFPQPSDDPDGRYSNVDPYRFDTSALAAIGTWEVLQGFIENLPSLDETVGSRSFNLWTESYGGHYGPAFFKYFYDQNALIKNGSIPGVELELHTLGIINGIISSRIQMPYYPEFAYKNTYGIEALNETIYNFTKMVLSIPGGCLDYLDYCEEADLTTLDGVAACSQSTAICRSLVEGPYENLSGRSAYDVRANNTADIPPTYWSDYLNTAFVQNALGVDVNYTSDTSYEVYDGFDYTGDHSYAQILGDLEDLLDSGVRVALIYGDADYICNWFGGEAVSLQVNYTHSTEFQSAGYAPFVVDGVEYGESRQYGNFSFTRVYESGHEVPYYQPKAALELFRRVLEDLAVSDGSVKVTPTYESNGTATATHTEEFTGWFTGRSENK